MVSIESFLKNNHIEEPYFPEGIRFEARAPLGWWEEVGTVLKYQYQPMYYAMQKIGRFEKDESFSPAKHIDWEIDDASYLMDARSMNEFNWMKANHRKILKIKEDMGNLHMSSMVVSALLDPVTWMIPFSITGRTITKGVKSGLYAGAKFGALSEGIRAPFDPTNTASETAINIGASMGFGGLIGGVTRTPLAVRLHRRAMKRAKKHNDDITQKFSQKVKNTPLNLGKLEKEFGVKIKVGKINVGDAINLFARRKKGERYIPAKYNNDTRTVTIDEDYIMRDFKNKPWTKPKVEGVDPLPEDAFSTPQEWFNFNLMHELEHAKTRPYKREGKAHYKNRVNKNALKRFEDEQQAIKDSVEPEGTWDLAFPNKIGNIISSPYRTAVQFKAKIGGALPDEVKKYFHMGFADGSLVLKAHFMGKSVQSVLQRLGKHWGFYADKMRELENLHYQQVMNIAKKPDTTLQAPRSYFGYTKRDKLWTKRDGNTFGEFLERAVRYHILGGNEQKIIELQKQGTIKDLSFLRMDEVAEFNRKLTPHEKEASKVIEEFFAHYEQLGKDSDMFAMSGTINDLRKGIGNLERSLEWNMEKGYTRKVRELEKEIAVLEKSLETYNKKKLDYKAPPWEEKYFARIFDKVAIMENKEIFTKIVEAWFTHRPFKTHLVKYVKIKTGKAKGKWRPKTQFVTRQFSTDPKDIRKRAEKFVQELIEDDNPANFADAMHPLKEVMFNPRMLDAPNYFGFQQGTTVHRLGDFIVTDPASVMKNYVLRVSPKIEFKKVFGMSPDRVLENMELLMTDKGFEPESIAKIKQKWDVMYRRVAGQVVEKPERWDNELAQNLRMPAIVTWLSDSGRAAIVDSGNMVFQYGFKPFQKIMETMVRPETFKHFTKVSRKSGEGLIEQWRGSTQTKVVDANLTHPVTRGWAKVRDTIVDYSMELNMLRPITTIMKEGINIFSMQEIIEKSLKYSQLTTNEKVFLARHGISEDISRRIARQKKHMKQSPDKKQWFPNIEKWDDEVAVNGFLAGNQTYMNLGSLTATASDKFQIVDGVVYAKFKPWMEKFGLMPDRRISAGKMFDHDDKFIGYSHEYVRMQSGLAGLPFIFWNYGLAANQKILQAGFDPTRPLFHRLSGAAIMIGLGYMITRMRVSDEMWDRMSFSDRMARAVHLSGVTGMYSDLIYMNLHMYHGATGGKTKNFLIRPMYNPNTFDTIMEPFGGAYGLVGDVARGGYISATEGIAKGLAEMPYPLQYNMFIRDEIREMRKWLRN